MILSKKAVLLLSFILVSGTFYGQENKLLGWWKLDGKFIQKITEDMIKTATPQEKKQLKMFLPMLKRMLTKRYTCFTKDEITDIYAGRERKVKYKYIGIKDNVCTIEVKGRKRSFILKDGRIVAKPRSSKKPALMYMCRMNNTEVAELKKQIEKANQPPPATAEAEKRVRFLIYRAKPDVRIKLLKEQPDLITIKTGHNQETALFKAVSKGDITLVKDLVNAGANVNILNKQGENPLFSCVNSFRPSKEIFELLIAKGANPKIISKNKSNLLITAAGSCKDINFLKHLLSLGIDINSKDAWGRSALSEALRNNQKIVQLLMAKGAEVSVLRDKLSYFVRKGDLKSLDMLTKNGITKDQQGRTILMLALQQSKSRKVKKILPKLVNTFKSTANEIDKEGKNALFYTQNSSRVKLLVKNGADPKVKSKQGISVLHQHNLPLETAKFYIEKCGVNVNSFTNRNEIPLQYAVCRGNNLNMIKYLISQKANVNHIDKMGNTPLSWALSKEFPERFQYVELLLKSGADPNKGRLEIVKTCINKGDKKALLMLKKAGMSFKTNPKEHFTPFWYAIFAKKNDMVKFLIENGADPKTKNAAGKTALDMAKEFKNKEIINLLSK